jgi:hypothetical protein
LGGKRDMAELVAWLALVATFLIWAITCLIYGLFFHGSKEGNTMTFEIHCGDDSIIIEGETIEEIREKAAVETSKRGWKEADCWSQPI